MAKVGRKLLKTVLLAGFAGLVGWSSDASACNQSLKKQRFLLDSGEGSLALVRPAKDLESASGWQLGWCQINSGSQLAAERNKVYFAINNFSDQHGQARSTLIKIFRQDDGSSQFTRMMARRFGDPSSWWSDCREKRSQTHAELPLYKVVGFDERLKAITGWPRRGSKPTGCSSHQAWFGSPFGRPEYNLFNYVEFLKHIPRQIPKGSVRGWSFEVQALAFETVSGKAPKNPPIFGVTLGQSRKVVVEVKTWPSPATTFTIIPGKT